MLIESRNEDIYKLVNHLDQKILELRTVGTEESKKYLTFFQELQNNDILPWMYKYYITEKETPKEYEENFNNQLLEFLNLLNIRFNKKEI